MSTQEVSVKLFLSDPKAVPPKDYIPIFHRWIQTSALDEVLIDVADYGHVHHGPGVILVCHGAIYGIDEEGGRPGLMVRRRRDSGGGLAAQLLATTRAALIAAEKLEKELAGKVRFLGDSIEVSLFSRLLTPNTDDTLKAVRPTLDSLFTRLFAGAAYDLVRAEEPRSRFLVRVTTKGAADASTLLSRISNEALRG